MMDRHMDDVADAQSEVLKELISVMAAKDGAKVKHSVNVADEMDVFDSLEKAIRADKKLSFAFRSLKDRFRKDAAFKAATDPLFVEAVEMMDLEDDDDK